MSFSEDNEILKVILLGSPGVGKTSIINRYYDNYFPKKQNLQ